MRRRYALLSVALLYLGSACMQDPEAPHNQPDTPTLSVDETSVTRVSMLVNGSFGHDLTDITSYGVELSTTLFESGGEVQTLTPQEVGPDGYALGISGLSPNETYYLRAFISNGHSKMYSSVITQKTPETSVASVSDVTLSADGTYMTATLEDNGGRSVEEVGFVWGSTNDRRSLRREKRYPATLSDDGKSFKLPVSYIGKGTHYVLAYAEDNKEATGFSRIALERIVRDDEPLPEFQPANEIWYTTSDGSIVTPARPDGFNSGIVSNTYDDGKGIIVFESDLTTIGGAAFWGATFTSIQLPASLTTIESEAFGRCLNLTSFTVPESVTMISPFRVFSQIPGLTSFYGKYATSDHRALIADGVMVGFAPKGLTEYTVENGVKELGAVFEGCSNLSKINLPEGLEIIGHEAFERCTSLSSIELPSTVTTIGSRAFESCSSLKSIDIPQSVTSIRYDDSFNRCSSLSSFTGKYASDDGHSLIINQKLCGVALAGIDEYTVPQGITTTCYIESKDLKKLEFPSSVTSIGQISYCEKLEQIIVRAVTPPTINILWWFSSSDQGSSAFFETNNCPIYVPAESLDAYKAADEWKDYAERIMAIPADWKPNHYLTFTSEGTTTISLINNGDNAPVLFYSYDKENWSRWEYSELSFTVSNPLFICGDNPEGFNYGDNTYSCFSSSGDLYAISGDIMSLLNTNNSVESIPNNCCFLNLFLNCTNLKTPPELPATTLNWNCYYRMFKGSGITSAPVLPATQMVFHCYCGMFENCTNLTVAPDLPSTALDIECYTGMFEGCTNLKVAPSLPATTLAEGCYFNMFTDCSSLESAPELPAPILVKNAYINMFNGCSSLTTAPELPATTLAENCYWGMFGGCEKLTVGPKLPAAILEKECYSHMFYACSNLNYIECMATDISAADCTTNWLGYVASSGTFVKAASMNDWTTGGSGIPEGWTVLNEDGTAPIAPSKYLTFTSEGTTKLSLSNQGYAPVLYYSFDTTSWTQWDYGELSFAADKPLYICGDNANGLCPDSNVYTVNVFTASGDLFAVSGDIMSLLNKDEDMTAIPGNPGSSAISSCFYGLFRDCTILTSGPSLPASQLTPLCYSYMFSGCTALKVAPELPATIISTRCYDHMFEGCSALTEAPALSANSLAPGCYANMFQDCTGLSSAPELPATTLTGYCYDNMFQGCTRLTAAPVLPATAIDMYSYRGMFSGCTSLVTPPELPATSFKSLECYEEMFKGCTSLATAPALPVTELTNGCYANMFKDCTSLRTAPELPAEVLVRNCYYGMFENCSKLNYVKCLVKEVNDSANLNRWLYGVASSGTFVKSAQASNWPAGSSGIPEGWAVVNDGDTPSGGNEGTGEEDWN